MGGQPGATASEIIPGGGQLPLGLRTNNPGYIPDGGVAKALPGYKGAEGGFAAFETARPRTRRQWMRCLLPMADGESRRAVNWFVNCRE